MENKEARKDNESCEYQVRNLEVKMYYFYLIHYNIFFCLLKIETFSLFRIQSLCAKEQHH